MKTNNLQKQNNENRYEILKESIDDFLLIKDDIKTGIEDNCKIENQKKKIMKVLNASEEQWNDYKWQFQNRFTDANKISLVLDISKEEIEEITKVGLHYRYAISPYYLSLIDPGNEMCPIKIQSIPSVEELSEKGELDPMGEEDSTPIDFVTRRYPDRIIIKVTNMCGMYCRFCQRRRLIGECDKHAPKDKIKNAIEYVRENSEIRDVLITGGDPFFLSDPQIEWILKELRSIPHVEIIRFGTRTPVTLPQRITKNLVNVLKKYHPVYVNVHFKIQEKSPKILKKHVKC